MTHRCRVTIEISLISPFLMQGNEAGSFGIDARSLRDAAGRPVVPADQVKGLMRAGMATLARHRICDSETITRLFGAAPTDGATSQRGAALFADLVTDIGSSADGAHHLTRIRIDEATGSVAAGALADIELVAPPGQEVVFRGHVVLRGTPEDIARDRALLARAWALVPAIGSYKSAGFGMVADGSARLGEATPRPLVPPAADGDAVDDRVVFDITLDRPLLVDTRHTADNIREGATVIPGGVIKGALAEALRRGGCRLDDPAIEHSLSAIRISHAFPMRRQTEPGGDDGGAAESAHDLPLPMSLVSRADGEIRDALLPGRWPEGASRHVGILHDRKPVQFMMDWKDKTWREARDEAGLPSADMPRLERVHTQIGADHTSADKLLFSEVARSHLIGSDPTQHRRWRFEMARNDADPACWARLVAMVAAGLDGVGNNGAHADMTRVTSLSAVRLRGRGAVAEGDGPWAITLVTPAVMAWGDRVAGETALTTHAAYTEYWAEVLPGARLANYYARQRLAGGYQALAHRPFGTHTYYPFILTEPGSVFLIENATAKDIQRRLNTGLPVCRRPGGAPDWTICPFQPANGYGEILLNLVDHDALVEGLYHV
ncbi:hypothetical protein P7L78_03350 (plasmid) [Tistrella bauzanensis]|uniref:RAMP superfamily CRISPR-associated protein n=1 Tax=Tistrella arctica TaxID=3133430 RepID=A0ABU9YND4_9PROT